jgi:uncharacterized protein YigE (DUF2233 family)
MRNQALCPLFLILLLLSLGVSCQTSLFNNAETPPKQSPLQQQGWQTVTEGMERRVYKSDKPENGFEFTAYRLNNKLFQLDLAYNQTPKRLEDWHKELGSILVMNGAYFTENMVPTGLFVDEGATMNADTYDLDRSGTVVIKNGQLSFVSDFPASTVGLDLFQSFPLLVNNGEAAVATDSERIARRSVLATDEAGRILFLIVDKTPLSLYELSQILIQSDLELTYALNLDGGPSSGLLYNDGAFKESFLPLVELPIVLSVSAPAPAAPNAR